MGRLFAILFAFVFGFSAAGLAHPHHHSSLLYGQSRGPQGISMLDSAPVTRGNSIDVDVTAGHALNTVTPLQAIGAGVDSENAGGPAKIYTHNNVTKMLTAGLGPVSYRLYTELGVQDWHWNPQGMWSDPAGQGYFTGSSSGGSIFSSFGYRLPHRGFTHDQANDDDYGRLTDGDTTTYWKSNPYLTQHFTGESDTLHPQWVVIDLGARHAINAIKLWWTAPYAVKYQVQYWTGSDPINSPGDGHNWRTFELGNVTAGSGGTVTLRLSQASHAHEYVRVFMLQSSQTCDSHGSSDIRNCVGFALAEVGLGTLDRAGTFHDLVNHAADKTQTVTYASSVDSWHAPVNQVTDQEQPGLDLVFTSGLTRNIPAMVPVSMLYGIPDDAAAEISYLQGHYALSSIELGEEPDGQYILPEDYGALYVQWAKRLRSVTSLPFGGPVFQGTNSDVQAWPNASGDVSWLHRFLQYIAAHGQSRSLNFMSFEHYPFDACDANTLRDLLSEPDLVSGIVKQWHADGLRSSIPMAITELNFSANPGAVFQDLVGGLWFADFTGSFLANGGKQVYLYQYVPEPMFQNFSPPCDTFGSYGLFVGWNNYRVHYEGAQYFASQLIMQDWVEKNAANAPHTVLPAVSSIINVNGKRIVTSYALRRPDGTYSVLLVNKSPIANYRLPVHFHDGNIEKHYAGTVTMTTLDRSNYQWHQDKWHSYAAPDGPATTTTINAGANTTFAVPAESLVVLSGAIGQ